MVRYNQKKRRNFLCLGQLLPISAITHQKQCLSMILKNFYGRVQDNHIRFFKSPYLSQLTPVSSPALGTVSFIPEGLGPYIRHCLTSALEYLLRCAPARPQKAPNTRLTPKKGPLVATRGDYLHHPYWNASSSSLIQIFEGIHFQSGAPWRVGIYSHPAASNQEQIHYCARTSVLIRLRR